MNKALLVGINKYSGSPLRGCVNDILMTYKMLTEKLNFKNEDITILTDQESIKKNIMLNVDKLTTNVQSGDIIYFHYSGHGSQVNVKDWTDSDEVDGRDEIICPIDLDWNDPFRDHELGNYFKRTPKDSTVLVVLDCCHSGTGLRIFDFDKETCILKDPKEPINRFIPPPISNILSNPKIRIDSNLNFVLPDFDEKDIQTKKNNFLIDTTKQGDVILISGCQDNQTSADAWINNMYCGALTYTLNKVLYQANYDITYKTLIKEINRELDNSGFDQNPQLECKPDFFQRKFLK